MHPKFPEDWPSLSVVLSHDWLTGMRGGERVLELLCQGFPRAPVCTLLHNRAAVSDAINARSIVTSPLQRVPGIARFYRYFLPLYPAAVRALRTPPGRLLLSTSHCAAKGVRPPPEMKHVCYCFTPMRYAWTFYEEYFGRSRLKRAVLSPLLRRLRAWDMETSRHVDRFVTLSRHVQDRIRRFYGRDADVVYPPVDIDFFSPAEPGNEGGGGFDLLVSALVPYKRVDLAVRLYSRLDWPLKVVGVGTELDALRRLAGRRVELLGWRSNEEVRALYRACRCLVFPGEEDFGIVPVEAMACGRPVVAFRRGGVTESVVDGETGVFFDEQTEDALAAAVRACAAHEWDPVRIRARAEQFGPQRFIDGLDRCIRATLAGGREGAR